MRALLGLLLAGCGAELVAVDHVAVLAATGPHAVGYQAFDVRYRPPLADTDRTLRTLVWYPAEATTGDRPLYLLRTAELAITDAPPLDLGPRPVILFSHGHQAYASVFSQFTEHAASHGFVVISPNHTGNTFADGADRKTEIYYQRAHDLRAALDAAAARFSLSDRVLVAGHSFGGYTAIGLAGARYDLAALDAACTSTRSGPAYCATLTPEKRALFAAGLADPRFDALWSLDPGDFELFGPSGAAAVDRRVLHMVAEQSGLPAGMPEKDAYWSSFLGAEDVRVLLLGGAHNDFMDSCGAGVALRCSELEPRSVARLTRVYGLAFARRTLLEDREMDAILEGRTPVSPLVELNRR